MAELYDEFFQMLYLAKILHDSPFTAVFHERCGTLPLDCDMCYELAYDAISMTFSFTYQDYNGDYESEIWVFGDSCIDRFCNLCQQYESWRGLSEKQNPYRREIEEIIREGFRFPGYSYDFTWYLSSKDRGRNRLVLFTGIEFSDLALVPEGLLEIREGFDSINLRLEAELGGKRKEAA